jgi:hypothetical protein
MSTLILTIAHTVSNLSIKSSRALLNIEQHDSATFLSFSFEPNAALRYSFCSGVIPLSLSEFNFLIIPSMPTKVKVR